VSKSRHPNQFHVKRAASPNILTLGGNIPRAIAKTHANQLAAWLVSTANEPEKFMEVLIDVYAEKHGVENIPPWLRTLCPNWKPWDPPELRPGGLKQVKGSPGEPDARDAMNKRAKKAGPIKSPSQVVRESGGGAGKSRFVGADGQPLDNEALLRQAEEAEAILRGEKPAPKLQNGNGGSDEEEPSETEEETEETEDENEPDDDADSDEEQDQDGGGQ
jgi:hypothetical protein